MRIVTSLAVMAVATTSAEGQVLAASTEWTVGGESPPYWDRIQAVALRDTMVIAMSTSFPALHAFHVSRGSHLGSWANEGGGPGELVSPAGVAVLSNQVYVVDASNGRLTAYDREGDLLSTLPLRDLGFSSANRLAAIGDAALLFGTFAPGSLARSLIVWRPGGRADTLYSYDLPSPEIDLSAPGGPGLRVRPPFQPAPTWTGFGSGVAVWPGHGNRVSILDLEGQEIGSFPVPSDRFEVTVSDKEWWFETAIPQDFMGRRVFEPARNLARRTVAFPDSLPAVLALQQGMGGTLWIQRTTATRGAVWDVVHEEGRVVSRLTLEPGDELLAVQDGRALVKHVTSLGTESLRMYFLENSPVE